MNVLEHAKPQWNGHTCGPAALRCALLVYGDRVDGRKLAELANTDPGEGTDDAGLAFAAAIFGLKIRQEILWNEADAALRLRENLHDKKPVLMACDDWSHWTVAMPHGRKGSTLRHVWLADPSRDREQVVERYTWRQLLRRAHWGLPDEIRFDWYVLEP